MREVGSGFDWMEAILMMILMLSVCVWAITSMRNNSEILVEERTSVHNVFGQAVEQPIQTAEDALMLLVTGDPYTPTPTTVLFRMGIESYTVSFNNSHFQDQEASIEKAWSEFFTDKMHATVHSVTLDITNNRWVIELVA